MDDLLPTIQKVCSGVTDLQAGVEQLCREVTDLRNELDRQVWMTGIMVEAGARLTQLVMGQDVINGAVQCPTNQGFFSEYLAHRRIRQMLQQLHPDYQQSISSPVGEFILKADYEIDHDVRRVLAHWSEAIDALILEVGANDEHLADLLTEHGYTVWGVDLRPPTAGIHTKYIRIVDDFCTWAQCKDIPRFDTIVTTSALEHFGLGTYSEGTVIDADYDYVAMQHIWNLLKPGGHCYLTVPYGKKFIVQGNHWRIYNQQSLQERLIDRFTVIVKEFFLSVFDVPLVHVNGNVTEAEANQYAGGSPHLTVLLKLQKNTGE